MSIQQAVKGHLMSTEVMCGNMKKLSLRFVAERAATAILEFSTPRAVTVEPCGRVIVESLRSACESDMLGVYDGMMGHDGLVDTIQDELRFELARRKWKNKVEARRALGPKLSRAA